MTSTDDATWTPSMGQVDRTHRIAITAGRIAIPPSYFLVDLVDSLQGSFDFGLVAQRLDIPADTLANSIAVQDSANSPLRCLAAIRSFSPDLIHQHWATWSTPAVAATKRLDVPLVVSVHGYDAFLPRSNGLLGPLVDGIKRLERRRSLAAATAVVVNSQFMANRLADLGVDSERVEIVRHVVDTDSFSPSTDERRGVAFVGRLSVEKGCDLLIEALSRLDASKYEVLHIVGSGPEELRLKALARDLGVQCHFHGKVLKDDVIRIMQGARLVVVPSRPARGQVEASGIAPLEAQACGTPALVTSVGGLPENIPSDLGSMICEPAVLPMAEAISDILASDFLEVSEHVRSHVVKNHHRGLLRERFSDLYTRLIDRG